MAHSKQGSHPHRLNVLVFGESSLRTPSVVTMRRLTYVYLADGGGVRGISSLLILQDLMCRVNACVGRLAPTGTNQVFLEPHDLFKLVAGTSTGGLIAIMLGKLGMTVQECIDKYHELSRTIFKKKNFRGGFTHGLAQSKYSGKRLRQCVSDLIHHKGLDREVKMVCSETHDRVACAVVCRELTSSSKYSQLKRKPVCICNLPCNIHFPHSVCDAARATSAAPTFFPVVKVGDRCFVDGGMEYNNPSHAIQNHYGQEIRVRSSKAGRPSAPQLPSAARHGNLDLTRVRYVNIGTGTKTDDLSERKRDVLASLVPSFIRTAIFLKETLTQIAVDSEKTAEVMRTFEAISHGDIIYDRFSAPNGVCFFKLDRWADLKKIEDLTKQYLAFESTKIDLERVAEDLASEYLELRRTEAFRSDPVSTTVEYPEPLRASARAERLVSAHVEEESIESQKLRHRMPALPSGEESGDSTVTDTTQQMINAGNGSRQSTPPSDLEETSLFPHTDLESEKATSTAQTTPSTVESKRPLSHTCHEPGTAPIFQAAASDNNTQITCP